MQTGASALLAAASIATLYSLVRFFDLFRRNPAGEAEPQRVDFEQPVAAGPREVRQEARALQATIEPRLVVDNLVEVPPSLEQLPAVEEMAPPVKSVRRAKTPRKSAEPAKGSKKARKTGLPPVEESDMEASAPDPVEVVQPEAHEESFHPPVAPLFEPEPFVRQQQRAMFGRKAG